ncbi:MAG: hypothetical protein J5X21_09660 [Candidatus Accumulibacter sp.]|jgi:hypothetical protein|nr:hypothetical protein [Candidatus Accumulibacter conexus]
MAENYPITGDDITRAACQITAAAITVRSLHDLIRGSCPDDAGRLLNLTEAVARDIGRQLDYVLAALGRVPNGFFDQPVDWSIQHDDV